MVVTSEETLVRAARDLAEKGLKKVFKEGEHIWLPGIGEAFGMGGSHTATTYFPQDALTPVSSKKANRLIERALDGIAGKDAGLYTSIPFCETACTYCPYNFSIGDSNTKEYLAALNKEIDFFSRAFSERGIRASSWFLGGGTPTILSLSDLERLLATMQEKFDFTPDAQLCVEGSAYTLAGPDGEKKLKLAKDYGINRISFGVQSFDAKILKLIGRGNEVESDGTPKAIRAIDLVANHFGNFNIDLIQGLRGQDEGSIRRDIETIARLQQRPTNVTWYQNRARPDVWDFFFLTKNPSAFPLQDQERSVRTRILIWNELEQLGFKREYGDKFILHNATDRFKKLRASTESAYIGMGADAYSHTPTLFWANALSHGYQRRLTNTLTGMRKQIPSGTDHASALDDLVLQANHQPAYETLVAQGHLPTANRLRRYTKDERLVGAIALGLKHGIDLDNLREKYGDAVNEYRPTLAWLEQYGLVRIEGSHALPTDLLHLFENEVGALLYSHPVKMSVFPRYRKDYLSSLRKCFATAAAAAIVSLGTIVGLNHLEQRYFDNLRQTDPTKYEKKMQDLEYLRNNMPQGT